MQRAAKISVEFVAVTTAADIVRVAALAREIWCEHYTPIIGASQVEYMLGNIQSPLAIKRQLEEGSNYQLIVADAADAGYFAFSRNAASNSLLLSKLYVRRSLRRLGLGARAVDWMAARAKTGGFASIRLTVNKRNASIAAYERMGFAITEAVVTDIGNGFVMDDYCMAKSLS